MPAERLYPKPVQTLSLKLDHERQTSPRSVLDLYLEGQEIGRIAGILKRPKDSITSELWKQLEGKIEAQGVNPRVISDGIKSGRLPLDYPIPPAYIVKPWLNQDQWQVFELLGQGETPERVAFSLGRTRHEVINLAVQARETFEKHGLKATKRLRTQFITMRAVQNALPDEQRQIMFDVIDSRYPVKIAGKDPRKLPTGKQEWRTIAGRYKVLFYVPDRNHYGISMPIDIEAIRKVGTVWLTLAQITLEEGGPKRRFVSSTSGTSLAIISRLKEVVDEFISEWEAQQREKKALVERSNRKRGIDTDRKFPEGNSIIRREPYDQMSEEELVGKAIAGDTNAVGKLYEDQIGRIVNFLRARVDNPQEAEDLAEEVFARTIVALHRYEQRGNPFSAWLFKVARNVWVSKYMRNSTLNGTIKMVPLEEIYKQPEAPDFFYDKVEKDLALVEALRATQHLPPAERAVMELRLGGLSVPETAKVLAKTENNIKVSQFKAIKRLKKRLRSKFPHNSD